MALESGYDGDEALTALLSAAGGETNINSVRALIDGVNGAAPADDSWMSLVTPRLDDKLRTQLDALRNEMAAAGTVDFSIARIASASCNCGSNLPIWAFMAS